MGRDGVAVVLVLNGVGFEEGGEACVGGVGEGSQDACEDHKYPGEASECGDKDHRWGRRGGSLGEEGPRADSKRRREGGHQRGGGGRIGHSESQGLWVRHRFRCPRGSRCPRCWIGSSRGHDA